MTHNIFIVELNGKRYGYTKEMLEAAGFSPVDNSKSELVGDKPYKEDYQKDTNTLSGTWCFLTTKEEWLDKDNYKVEESITDQKPPFYRHDLRWDTMVALTGITNWNLGDYDSKWTLTEDGLSIMPMKVSQLIKSLVVGEFYGAADNPLFQMSSTKP